jgi:hypothetical protein
LERWHWRDISELASISDEIDDGWVKVGRRARSRFSSVHDLTYRYTGHGKVPEHEIP